MRYRWLVAIAFLAGCGREQTAPIRRLVVLPIENLTSEPSGAVDAAALQLALWDGLQAQPSLHAVMAGHRRALPEIGPAIVVSGYTAAGQFRLRIDDESISCAGSLGDCAARLVGEVAKRAGVTARATPNPQTLRAVASAGTPGQPADALEKAAMADPLFGATWLSWAAQVRARDGSAAAEAVLRRAPIKEMSAYDAARIRVILAELQQDRLSHARAMAELAAMSQADFALQEQAAMETVAGRDLAGAMQIYDSLIARSPQPRFLNQAAYVAAFSGDRAKAERYANAAQAAGSNDPQYADTRGEVAYYFSDFSAAARYFENASGLNVSFLGGLELWKAADAARRAGEKVRAEALIARYLEVRTKAGLRNTLVLQAVWDWRGDAPDSAMEKLRTAEKTTDRGKALFLQALIALNRRDLVAARRIALEIDPNAIERAVLRSVLDGAEPPAGLPFSREAVRALHHFVNGRNKEAAAALGTAIKQMDPLAEGQWRKLESMVAGKPTAGLLPASPDDWLAVLLR